MFGRAMLDLLSWRFLLAAWALQPYRFQGPTVISSPQVDAVYAAAKGLAFDSSWGSRNAEAWVRVLTAKYSSDER